MNWCKHWRTSTGKKEAVPVDRRKLIGLLPKRPFASIYRFQELNSGQARISTLDWRALNIESEPFHNLESKDHL